METLYSRMGVAVGVIPVWYMAYDMACDMAYDMAYDVPWLFVMTGASFTRYDVAPAPMSAGPLQCDRRKTMQ